MEVCMGLSLSPAAQAIINAGKNAANEGGDTAAIDRAVEKAIFDLSISLPQGKKAQVTEALTEIAQAYTYGRISRDPLIGPFKATVKKLAGFSSSTFFLELEKPLRGIKYVVVDGGGETKGVVDFWNHVGDSDPVGKEVNILKMSPGSEAYKALEIAIVV
jgi:hypothetical protein